MGQGTVEQQAEWIGRAWTCSIIGTYAQVKTLYIDILKFCRLRVLFIN